VAASVILGSRWRVWRNTLFRILK